MKPYIKKLRYKVIGYLVVLLAGISPAYVSAANLVGTYTGDYGEKYNLYDDGTAELADAHSVTAAEVTFKGYFNDGENDYVVTKIAEGAFIRSGGFTSNIKAISILGGVKYIDASAFKNCTKLTKIYLPPTLETIDASAFEGCTALNLIYCAGYSVPALSGGDTFTGIDITKMNVFVPSGCTDLYKDTSSPFSKAAKIGEKVASELGQEIPEFILSAAELTFVPGQTQTLHISLDNAEILIGFQFDLYLPDGLSLAGNPENNYDGVIDSKNANGQNSHSIDISKVANGSYRFLSKSLTRTPFSKTEDLITINVKVADNFVEGEIWFKDIIGVRSGSIEVDGHNKCYLAEIPEVPVTSITLDKTEVTLRATQTASFTVTYNPSNATKKKVTWTTSDSGVATVSAAGVVTAVKVGTATITATTSNGKTATATVTVEPTPATSITITQPQSTTLNVGESAGLSVTVLPELTTDKTVTWVSSNSDVATVDSNGKVTAKKPGTVEITATCGSVSDKLSLVITNYVKSIALDSQNLTIEKGREVTLVATYSPSDATPVSLDWSSSDNTIATVNTSGRVSCLKPGTVVITVKDTKSGLSAICEILVIDTLYGDADNDGHIAVNDVVLIVNHILERNPVGFVFDRADVDKNGKINIVDVTMTIDLILAQTPESVSRARTAMNTRSPNDVLVIDNVQFGEAGGASIPIFIDTEMQYTALQFDIKLPEGLEMEQLALNSTYENSHMLSYIKLGDNTYRVMVFSSALGVFVDGDMLLNMKIKTKETLEDFEGGYVEIINGIASMANGKGEAVGDTGVTIQPFSEVEELLLDDAMTVSAVAGGIKVCSVSGTKVSIYTIAGSVITSQSSTGDDFYPLRSGIYIVVVNGKSHKITVK